MAVPRQEVVTLPMPQALRQKLLSAGLSTMADLDVRRLPDHSAACQLSPDEAEVLSTFLHRRAHDSGACLASELPMQSVPANSIVSFSADLDRLFGFGFPLGQVTELCGPPGIGKSQIGMQLAVSVQLPREIGGLAGEAVYLDTEGGFSTERVLDICAASTAHVHGIAAAAGPAQHQPIKQLTEAGLLGGIHHVRLHSAVDLSAAVAELPAYLRNHPKVRLVVVDSVPFQFRQDRQDVGERTRLLSHIGQSLMAIAGRHDICVATVNHVTTRVLDGMGAILIPSLGDSWAHSATNRLVLRFEVVLTNQHLHKHDCLDLTRAWMQFDFLDLTRTWMH